MPIWAYCYSLLLVGSGIQCLQSARRGRRPWWFAVLDLMTALAWTLVVVAYYVDDVSSVLGRAVLLVFGFALFWTLASTPFEMAGLADDPSLTPRANQLAAWAAVLVAAAFVSPAIALGLLTARRILGAAT